MKNDHYEVMYEMNQFECARFMFATFSEALKFARNSTRKSLIVHVEKVSETELIETLIAEVYHND